MDSSLNNALETEFTSLNMDDILTEIVYYTGGLEMLKCHMLVTADKIEEITKNLENGMSPLSQL